MCILTFPEFLLIGSYENTLLMFYIAVHVNFLSTGFELQKSMNLHMTITLQGIYLSMSITSCCKDVLRIWLISIF